MKRFDDSEALAFIRAARRLRLTLEPRPPRLSNASADRSYAQRSGFEGAWATAVVAAAIAAAAAAAAGACHDLRARWDDIAFWRRWSTPRAGARA